MTKVAVSGELHSSNASANRTNKFPVMKRSKTPFKLRAKMNQDRIGTSLTAAHLGESIIAGSDGMASNGDLSKIRYLRSKIFKIRPGLYIGCAGNKNRALWIKDIIIKMFEGLDTFAKPNVPRTVEDVVNVMRSYMRTEDELGFIVFGRVLDRKMQLVSVLKKENEEEVVKTHKKGEVVNLGSGAKYMSAELGEVCVDSEEDVIKFIFGSLLKGIKGDTRRSGGIINIILLMKKFVRRLLSDHRNNYNGFCYDELMELDIDTDKDGRTEID